MKVMGFAGWSGSGKTTLVERVVAALTARGVVVSLIKHAHHSFDIDHAGKDSWRHREAGCREVMIGSGRRWSLTHELRDEPEPTLAEMLSHLSPCDVVLVEGFKRATVPKIEVRRVAVREPAFYPDDPHIIAVATDVPLDCDLPQLDINDPVAVADFVIRTFALQPPQAGPATRPSPASS